MKLPFFINMQIQTKKTISDRSLDFYTKQLSKRRNWDVIEVSPDQACLIGAENTLSKALAMSQLELPVGDFIGQELQNSADRMDINLCTLLKLNQQDELKHDKALNSLRRVFPVKKEDDDMVNSFVKESIRLASIYSPITVAGVLESSLFFVILPMYRFLGSSGFRTIANDISNDENIHAATNVQLAEDLGYNRGKRLNDFRKEVIDWLTSDLPNHHDNKYLSRFFWQRSSENLYNYKKSATLVSTKKAVMPSFFETDNRDLPIYG